MGKADKGVCVGVCKKQNHDLSEVTQKISSRGRNSSIGDTVIGRTGSCARNQETY